MPNLLYAASNKPPHESAWLAAVQRSPPAIRILSLDEHQIIGNVSMRTNDGTAMSEASERAVRRLLEWGRAWDARDVQAILAGMDEDILYQNLPMPVIHSPDGADLGGFSQSMAAAGEFVDPNRYETAS